MCIRDRGVGLAVATAGDYDAEANVLLTALAYTEHGLRVPALKEDGRLPRLALLLRQRRRQVDRLARLPGEEVRQLDVYKRQLVLWMVTPLTLPVPPESRRSALYCAPVSYTHLPAARRRTS